MATFTITTDLIPSGAGVIDPPYTVDEGTNVWVYYRSNTGYRLFSVSVDGTDVNVDDYPNSYYFGAVDADHMITVRYEAVNYGCLDSDVDDCSVCNELVDVSPDLVVNGITPEICASLQNDTGLNPGDERTDGQDLDLMNSCLIGRQTDELEALELCDWKEFFYGLIPNIFNMFKAIICTLCGVWGHIHNIEDEVEQLWNSFDQLKEEVGTGMGTREDRELVLPANAIGPNYDIEDGWYTEVDASAVYDAGVGNGKKVAMCAVATADQATQTVTRTLPAGVYYYQWVVTSYGGAHGGGGPAVHYSGVATINYGDGLRSFNIESVGTPMADDNGRTGNGVFVLTDETSVTIQATQQANGNLYMSWAMICVYS